MKRTFALILALALMLALAACTPAETTPTAEPTLELYAGADCRTYARAHA